MTKRNVFTIVFIIQFALLGCNDNSVDWVLNGGFIEKDPPKLQSIYVTSETTLQLIFNEPLDIETAQNSDSYSIDPELEIISSTIVQWWWIILQFIFRN